MLYRCSNFKSRVWLSVIIQSLGISGHSLSRFSCLRHLKHVCLSRCGPCEICAIQLLSNWSMIQLGLHEQYVEVPKWTFAELSEPSGSQSGIMWDCKAGWKGCQLTGQAKFHPILCCPRKNRLQMLQRSLLHTAGRDNKKRKGKACLVECNRIQHEWKIQGGDRDIPSESKHHQICRHVKSAWEPEWVRPVNWGWGKKTSKLSQKNVKSGAQRQVHVLWE